MSLLRDLFTKRAPVADDSPPAADAPPAPPEPSGADQAFVQGVLDHAAATMAPPAADAPPAPPEPSGADQAFVQGVLDHAAATMADAFVTSLLNEHRIVPAQAEQWRSALLTALRTDGGGQVSASATGAVHEGPMTAQVRSLAAAQPKHTLTQTVLPGAPEGSVIVPDPGQEQAAHEDRLIAVYRSVGGFGGAQ